jgi:hypothetical protein
MLIELYLVIWLDPLFVGIMYPCFFLFIIACDPVAIAINLCCYW